MDFYNSFIELFEYDSVFDNNLKFFLFLFLILLIYNFFAIYLRDKLYLKAYKNYKDPEKISINDLNDIPLVNIIVPSWKQGKEFEDCLLSITKLNYPKIKVIVNAGGNEQTTNIAEKFRKCTNFIILHQTGGKSRAAFGKIKALNECLDYISEGLIYFIDADCYLTDEILLRIIYPIINLNENVVISTFRPLRHQETNTLVNYLQISRVGSFKKKFSRYEQKIISGSNTCMKFEVIKAIGKFNDANIIAEDISRAQDIISKGFRIYSLVDYKSRMFSSYPETIKEYCNQRVRYFENSLLYSYQKKNLSYFIKFLILIVLSFYIILLPFLLLIHLGFLFLGIFIIMHIYLIKVRRFLFFCKIYPNTDYLKYRKIFFLKIFQYIIFDFIINIITLFDLFFFIRNLKKERV